MRRRGILWARRIGSLDVGMRPLSHFAFRLPNFTISPKPTSAWQRCRLLSLNLQRLSALQKWSCDCVPSISRLASYLRSIARFSGPLQLPGLASRHLLGRVIQPQSVRYSPREHSLRQKVKKWKNPLQEFLSPNIIFHAPQRCGGAGMHLAAKECCFLMVRDTCHR